jgi:hypothetical protein
MKYQVRAIINVKRGPVRLEVVLGALLGAKDSEIAQMLP